MAGKQTKKDKRNKKIVKDFNKLADLKVNNKRKYTYDYIYETLADRYYLEASTIEKIVSKTS